MLWTVAVIASLVGLALLLLTLRATTEAGHAPGRMYMDQDGTLHLNGTKIAVNETGQTLAVGEAEVVTATNAIAASENGKTFYLSAADGFTSTLPSPFLGGRFKFIVKTAPTTAYIIVTTGGDNLMYGHMLERAGTAGVAGAARDTFNFVANLAIVGDWVEFESDGTNWYYHGMVDVAAGNTVAAT